MVRKYITRDFTNHTHTTRYLSDTDEYIKLEIFSFDPRYTRKYLISDGSLKGENTVKGNFKSLPVLQSNDKVNHMEFSLYYNVQESGLYRVDIVYEQNSHIFTDTVFNTSKDLTGWYDIYPTGSKKEHVAETTSLKHIIPTTTTTSSKNAKPINTPKNVDKTTKKIVKQVLSKAEYTPSLTASEAENNRKLQQLLDSINSNQHNLFYSPEGSTDITFEGEDDVLKRKTIFQQLNNGDYTFEFGVPHNCYIIGAIIRKVITFTGTNNDEIGTQLMFTNAKLTHSEMGKSKELEATIGYDNSFEADTPTGLYFQYMDECNLYVRNSEGHEERVFGGYISTPLPDNTREEITIHCADRLRDGEDKYILNTLKIQGGDSNEASESEDIDTINFNKHSELLSYLCQLYECSLKHNIDPTYEVDEKNFPNGLVVTFGKKKDVKSVPVTNGAVTVNKNSVLLRNNSNGTKKQVFTLYDAKKVRKSAENITNLRNFHIKYGLGDVKTEHKEKSTVNVDVSDSTAGSQSFSKCGVSADKKYVMGIGQLGVGRGKKTYPYGTYYRSVFENKCPYCKKATLRWDSCRTDSNCINGRTKRNFPVPANETEITCTNCDCDFDVPTGYSKEGKYKYKLKKVGSTKKSSKAEQTKLHKGEMKAVADRKSHISADSIFKAIRNASKNWKHQTKTGQTASYLENHGVGDCWAWSDWISKQLKKYKVNHHIMEYATNQSKVHRSVMYQNSKGEYVNFPYSKYNFPSGTHATSKASSGRIHYKYHSGGRISQATSSGSTTKSETTETTITNGYDATNPFQGYLDICYSGDSKFNSKKYHIYVDFTQKSTSNNSVSGLNPVWVNNSSKESTFIDLISRMQEYSGLTNIFLQSVSFITPKKSDEKQSNWYTNDKSTIDNSSCKLLLYNFSFNNKTGATSRDLQANGKTINEIIRDTVETAGYIMEMEYGLHRCDDKINFHVNNNESAVFHAHEGEDNNILEWGNITYNSTDLFNNSICVFKKRDTNKYFYVDSSFLDSILEYGEHSTLLTENEPIGDKEAYWNARHNEKFNPEQVYSFTITVAGYPDIKLKELIKVTANAKKLNTIKEVDSMTLNYSIHDKPVLQTELGCGELAPDILVSKNIQTLRKNAKKENTYFKGSASPVTDSNVYEWDL